MKRRLLMLLVCLLLGVNLYGLWREFIQQPAHPEPVSVSQPVASSPVAPSASSDKPSQNTRFQQALPGYVYQFPQDHASHPAFKTEWWYYTGHVKVDSLKAGHFTAQSPKETSERWFGYELTFFRSATGLTNLPENPNWRADNFYLAHFALTDEQGQRFFHTQRLNRGAPGKFVSKLEGNFLDNSPEHSLSHSLGSSVNQQRAGASTSAYHVWNENWSVRQLPNGHHQLHAGADGVAISLTLAPNTPPVVHGENGVSQKAACRGCASHYYSYPRMQTTGTVALNGHTHAVTGTSWMDHEFGSNQLQPNQVGWDWFSLQLSDGQALMLYVMRLDNGQWDAYSSGTWVDAHGHAQHLARHEFEIESTQTWQSPHTQAVYPSGWSIRVPQKKLNVTVMPVLNDQELASPISNGLTYWEGRCRVAGQLRNAPVYGNAYVELTGYTAPFQQRI